MTIISSIIISILITGLALLVLYLVQKLPIDSTMKQMAQIVAVVVGVVSLLSYLDVF
ncbi:Thivi_2564 family membrane protein [Ensifer aridi]|uniref:Thivi_2564 family membrane protein n=1 Tax=Ensifer aridi TaxID=1708715 RepID=UPI00111C86C3